MKRLLFIEPNATIRVAMKQMDKNSMKILFAVDQNKKLLGSLTDGDVRRWILSNGSLNEPVSKALNPHPVKVSPGYDIAQVKRLMLSKRLEWIPIVSKENKFLELLTWKGVFAGKTIRARRKIPVSVVIMAGGKGERLDPFTKILPKALIPINDEPMIEIIMKKFIDRGINAFHVCVHHKAKMIKAYFEELRMYKVNFVMENQPLGTAGALRFLKGRLKGDFFVTNCDILIDTDYKEVWDFHKKNKNALTIVSSYKHFVIPYGVCHLEKGGDLKLMEEKPEHSLLVNTGMYVISSKELSLVPTIRSTGMFHMTDFIDILKKKGKKIGVYPVSEESWIDTGEWPEFRKALLKLERQS